MPILGLEKKCPSCERLNPAIHRSCMHCGAALSASDGSKDDAAIDAAAPPVRKAVKLVHPGTSNVAAAPAPLPPAQASPAKIRIVHPDPVLPSAQPFPAPQSAHVPSTAPMTPDLVELAKFGSKNQNANPQPPMPPVPLSPTYSPARPRTSGMTIPTFLAAFGLVFVIGMGFVANSWRKDSDQNPLAIPLPLPLPSVSIVPEEPSSASPPTLPALAPSAIASIEPTQPQNPTTLDEAFRQKLKNATVAIHSRQGISKGLGSGFFVDDDGRIVTNEHVIRADFPGRRLSIELYGSKEEFDDIVCIVRDPKRDLALLQLRGVRPKAVLSLHRGDRVPETTPVVVIGHPQQEFWSITQGTITGIREHKGQTFYGTDARIEPGNSGGPVVLRTGGAVIGVSDWKIMATSLNYAIPVDAVIELVSEAAGIEGKPCR